MLLGERKKGQELIEQYLEPRPTTTLPQQETITDDIVLRQPETSTQDLPLDRQTMTTRNVLLQQPGTSTRDLLHPKRGATKRNLFRSPHNPGKKSALARKLACNSFRAKRRIPFVMNLRHNKAFVTKKRSLLGFKRLHLFAGRRTIWNPIARIKSRNKRRRQRLSAEMSSGPRKQKKIPSCHPRKRAPREITRPHHRRTGFFRLYKANWPRTQGQKENEGRRQKELKRVVADRQIQEPISHERQQEPQLIKREECQLKIESEDDLQLRERQREHEPPEELCRLRQHEESPQEKQRRRAKRSRIRHNSSHTKANEKTYRKTSVHGGRRTTKGHRVPFHEDLPLRLKEEDADRRLKER